MTPETLTFDAHEWVPNNPRFPVLVYREVLSDPSGERAEAMFTRNGWAPLWRYGIFPFHHYHSKAHEALAVVQGGATLMLGGPGGETSAVSAGDVLVLPAGTGHRCLEDRDGFLVVGAYPPGQEDYDTLREAPDADALERIRTLSCPGSDPVEGAEGPLSRLWPE